jgi:hypothetical protein
MAAEAGDVGALTSHLPGHIRIKRRCGGTGAAPGRQSRQKAVRRSARAAFFMVLMALANSKRATNASKPNDAWWRCAGPDIAIPRYLSVRMERTKVQSRVRFFGQRDGGTVIGEGSPARWSLKT